MKTMMLIMVLTSAQLATAAMSTKELRNYYYKAAVSESNAAQFYSAVTTQNNNSPITVCYKGLCEFLKAKYGLNPYLRLRHFSAGRRLMEEAISAAPGDAEIRFMRLCIQMNAPVFLGYRSDIDSDKEWLRKRQTDIADVDLREKIAAIVN